MEELHQIQLEILRKLLFKPNATFTDLIYGETNTMLHSYHLKTLIKADFITKENGKYRLTSKGKEYANRLDTENINAQVERQPKISIACYIFKGENYDTELLVQTRLKEPFFGYMGGITGKAKFGETAFETAQREVIEETGLTGDLFYHGVAHFINYHQDELVEDKYFLVFSLLNSRGELLSEGEGFMNQWMTMEKFQKQSPIYDGAFDLIEMCSQGVGENFIETRKHLRDF